MAKYKDTRGLGKSKLVPKGELETASDRHYRRKEFNFARAKELGDFLATFGIRLKITNGGHHWRTMKDDKVVEWWPSSAKVVVHKHGIHCHDYEQFISILRKEFEIV